MADQPIPLGDPHEEGALSPEEAAAQDAVIAALGSLDALRPGSPAFEAAMPEEVWSRLQATLAAESAARAAAGPTASAAVPGRRRTRWAGGLVAASVAVLAVGIAVTVVRPGSSESITAAVPAEATVAAASPMAAAAQEPVAAAVPASPQKSAGDTADEPPAGTSDGAATPQEPTTLELRSGEEPAARVVLASSTNYTPTELPGQVATLFASMGVDSPEEAMAMPITPVAMPVADGFTASWQALRDCVTWLTESPDAQALVVDRAQFLGTDAGVVVAPGDAGPALGEEPAADPGTGSPAPSMTVDALVGSLDVWVVDPTCTKSAGSIREYLDYRWQE